MRHFAKFVVAKGIYSFVSLSFMISLVFITKSFGK